MNLREKIEKEITNKVMTKLASEKVELNAVEDTMKKAAKIGGKILSLESDILSAASDIKKLSSDYTQYINNERF